MESGESHSIQFTRGLRREYGGSLGISIGGRTADVNGAERKQQEGDRSVRSYSLYLKQPTESLSQQLPTKPSNPGRPNLGLGSRRVGLVSWRYRDNKLARESAIESLSQQFQTQTIDPGRPNLSWLGGGRLCCTEHNNSKHRPSTLDAQT
jgi:hypothetical protein